MKTSRFTYTLPKELIAQSQASPKESARLMTITRDGGDISHRFVRDLPDLLHNGDLVIINDTKVFRARLLGTVLSPDGKEYEAELFLLRPDGCGGWVSMGKPGRWFKPGARFLIHRRLFLDVIGTSADGLFTVAHPDRSSDIIRLANRYGHVPVPPYIAKEPALHQYQTSYATHEGSVAAPTAGFHLTAGIRKRMEKIGVSFVRITLHVGPGTFRPIKTQTLESHTMDGEQLRIPRDTAREVMKAKAEGRRVIAIGTTVARTLEGVASANDGRLVEYEGDTDIFIRPGWNFRIMDGLLTNFHLPESTLLALVSAFAGHAHIMRAYKEAVMMRYRFFSFGDAMFIS